MAGCCDAIMIQNTKVTRNRQSITSNTGHSDLINEIIGARFLRNIYRDRLVNTTINAKIVINELGIIWVNPDIHVR